jgi:hypothetical protein
MAHRIVSTPLFLAAVLLLLVQSSVEAFSSLHSTTCHRPSLSKKKCVSTTATSSSFSPLIIGRIAELRMSNGDEEAPVGLPPLPSQLAQTAVADETNSSQKKEEETVVSSSTSATTTVEEETTSYPIDLPSPILLASSMVLAISSTGSLFELTGGSPQLGFPITATIAAVGLPLSVFLIYAAILKGAAETEEADREFNRPRRL